MKSEIESRLFKDDGRTPNNSRLPFLLIRSTAAGIGHTASWFERCFQENGWGSTWRWTVYPYHHFHSTNHEVLGVSQGEARLMLGGEHGGIFQVSRGDVLIIPAGVGHKRVEESEGFQVVGGYPGGLEPDLLLPGIPDLVAARQRIASVSLPARDPLTGEPGVLFDYWKQ
jgi:uncharacterized protein YjlB